MIMAAWCTIYNKFLITAKHQTKEPEINMNENFAYEKPPVMSPSGINMEENSAYGAFEIL